MLKTQTHYTFLTAFLRDCTLTLQAAERGCINELEEIFSRYTAEEISTMNNAAGGYVHTNTELASTLRKKFGLFER